WIRSIMLRAAPRTRGPGLQRSSQTPCCGGMTSPPRIFDRNLHRRRLDRAAAGWSRADFLRRRAAESAVDSLTTILRPFARAVDLSAHGGVFAELLADSPAAARVGPLISADLSARSLTGRPDPRLVLDEEALPFA